MDKIDTLQQRVANCVCLQIVQSFVGCSLRVDESFIINTYRLIFF